MTTEQLIIGEQMYRFIAHIPCACVRNDGSWPFRSTSSTDVKTCQRCLVMASWEALRLSEVA